MEFTAEDAKELIRAAWAILSSPLAQRIYVLTFCGWTIFASLRSALRADREARSRIEGIRHEFRDMIRIDGRPAFRQETVDDQRSRILQAGPTLRDAAKNAFFRSVLAGVLVPSVLLFLAVMYFAWFNSAGGHVLDSSGRLVTYPPAAESLIFVIDQTFRGGLFDLLEVFDLEITTYQNNPRNFLFSTGLFAHHLFIEAFIFSGLALFAHNLWTIQRTQRATLVWFDERTRTAQDRAAASGETSTEAESH